MPKAIHTALLSYGLSGKVFHAPFLRSNPDFKLVGAWERSKDLLRKDYPEARSYKSLEELLNDLSVDLVVVNSPTHTHFEFATLALNAGKHVVVEKAFTNNAMEAAQLIAAAKAANRTLTVYQNRRWDSDFKTVQKVYTAGELGQLVEARISFERFNPALSPKAHREEPGPGAGNLMDLGPHLVDEALVLFGIPDAVFGDIRSCRPGSRVDDYFDVLLFYPLLRVRLFSSYLVREPSPGFVLHGLGGSFIKNRSDAQEVHLRKGGKPTDAHYGMEPDDQRGILTLADGTRRIVETERGNYGDFYEALSRTLTNGTKAPVTGEEGLMVMKVLDAARESSRTQKVVNL